MKRDILTKLQRAFVNEYLKSTDLNGAECVRRAGYKTKYPDKIASQLLGNARVWGEIRKAMAKREERTKVTQDRVVRELALLGFSDLKDYITIDDLTGAIQAKGFEEMPGETSRALQSIQEDRVIKEDADGKKTTVYDKVKFKTHDKIRALEILARHLGMLVERHEVTGEDGGPIKIEYVLMKKKEKAKG